MKVSDLRGILQYVPRFRDKIFVVALDGEIVASPNFANISRAVTLNPTLVVER